MSAGGKKIAVGVFCSDWRLHQEGVHINNAVFQYLGVDGVDMLAVPGPDGILAPERATEKEVLVKNIQVLIGAHKPITIVFVAHYNCAGHAVPDEQHDRGIKTMMEEYKKLLTFDGEMVALCATHQSDTHWPLKEIARM